MYHYQIHAKSTYSTFRRVHASCISTWERDLVPLHVPCSSDASLGAKPTIVRCARLHTLSFKWPRPLIIAPPNAHASKNRLEVFHHLCATNFPFSIPQASAFVCAEVRSRSQQ